MARPRMAGTRRGSGSSANSRSASSNRSRAVPVASVRRASVSAIRSSVAARGERPVASSSGLVPSRLARWRSAASDGRTRPASRVET